MEIRPKKSLGQHFLRSEKAIADIINGSKIKIGESVLEIGPGEGVLTEALLNAGAHVYAVEKDVRAREVLENRFRDACTEGRLILIEGDILDTDLMKLGLATGTYQVIANIPYYITGILIRHMLENDVRPRAMTLLVQYEVARRIISSDNKQSLLSLAVSAYGKAHIVARVKAGSFVPQPKVDSAIIRIEDIGPHKAGPYAVQFWTLTKKAFNGKRKTLMHSIGSYFIDPIHSFSVCNISPTVRPETVSLHEWICLTKEMKSA